MSLEAAALCEPLSVAIWSSQEAGVAPGSRVLVTGAGPVGILVVQVARAFGAAEVIVSDPAPERRAQAEQLGATRVLDPTVVDVGALHLEVDAFVEASGAPSAVRAGIFAVKAAGRVVLVGMGSDPMTLPVSRIQAREIAVTGVFRYANTWPLAIQLVASGQVDVDALVTSRFGLDHVEEALKAAGRPTTLKALVLPGLR